MRPNSTRQAILVSTLELLEKDGYANATTDQIALTARVSKASIYRFWKSKQELVVEAASLRFQPIVVPDLGDFEAEVRYLLDARMSDYRQEGTLRLVAALLGAASNDSTLEEAFENWVDRLSATIRLVIQRGIARGQVEPNVDTYALESVVAGILAQRCHPASFHPECDQSDVAA